VVSPIIDFPDRMQAPSPPRQHVLSNTIRLMKKEDIPLCPRPVLGLKPLFCKDLTQAVYEQIVFDPMGIAIGV